MEPCKRCGSVSIQNGLAMWRIISGYHPSAGYTKGKKVKLIPEYIELQGTLCPQCIKTLGGWPVEKLTSLSQPKQKSQKITPLSLWDAFH